MSIRQHREFHLNEDEILGILVAEDSGDEDNLILDEEDRQFLAEDMDAGVTISEILPPESLGVPLPNVSSTPDPNISCPRPTSNFTWRRNQYVPNIFQTNETYVYGAIKILQDEQVYNTVTPIQIYNSTCKFNKLLDDIIIPESMKYAEQQGRVFTIDHDEMSAFIGMNYVMGYHSLPTIRSYWSTDPDMGVPYIAQVMTLHRFEEIRRNLHFNDNNLHVPRTEPTHDRAFKIRPVFVHFNASFKETMNNTVHQSIDEHMVKFKGHNIMRQYVKSKPIKWGFKMWCRCDSLTGYLFDFDIYTGKKANTTEFGLGESVIVQLTRDLCGLTCEVYFDNFFNSPLIQHNLLTDNIKSCGTVRANRKHLPKNIPTDKSMKRGDIYTASSGGISFIKWMDNKAVHMLTNFISPVPTANVTRRQSGSADRLVVKCPDVIKRYNKYMGGVDLMDQKKVYYEVDRKSKIKYYLRLFFDILDIALNNSYVVYTKLHEEGRVEGPALSTLEFRQLIARSLIGGFSSRKRSLKDTVTTLKRRCNTQISSNHKMSKRNMRKRCAQCAKNKFENRTNNACAHCDVHLCYTNERNCFDNWHGNQR